MDSDRSTLHYDADVWGYQSSLRPAVNGFWERIRNKHFGMFFFDVPRAKAGIATGNVEEEDECKGAEKKDILKGTPTQKTRDVGREWRYWRGKETDVGAHRNARSATPGNRVQGTPIENVRAGRERRHLEIPTTVVTVSKDDYGSLMETFIPDDKDWVEFGKNYLMVDEQDLSRAERLFRDERLKKEILRMWITKYGGEATVSKAYGLAHKFRNDEFEEVFRFLVKLIPEAREWKNFAKYGLGLERSVYKEYEDEISNEQKLRMLRQWRQRGGSDVGVDELCIAVRTHFEGNPALVNLCKAVMDPLYESQKTISGGINKLCEAVTGMSMGKIHVQNSGTWNCGDPFIGCQGTTFDY